MARSNRYTLFCSTGGYEGPYLSLDDAETAAQRRLEANRAERWIEICPCVDNAPYTPHHYKPYGRPVKRISRPGEEAPSGVGIAVADGVRIPEVLPAPATPGRDVNVQALQQPGLDV